MPTDQAKISGNEKAIQAGVTAAANSYTNILTSDLVIVDSLYNIPSPQELATQSGGVRDKYSRLDKVLNTLFAERGAQPGSKFSINDEEFRTLSLAVSGLDGKMEPGGSTADILTTVKNLLDDKANIDFIGVTGSNDFNDTLITADFQKSGINLEPGADPHVSSALSFIFTHPDGNRTTITYPGNAATMLKPEAITDEKVAKSDTVFLPINLWSKFDHKLPETLLQKAWDQDKQLIVSIPKQARFGFGATNNIHQSVIPRADVIVADEEELSRLYQTNGNYESAISRLQTDMEKRNSLRAEANKQVRIKPATALIKHKNDSITILVASQPDVPAARYDIPVPASILGEKHTLGVDDAIYAGFIAGLSNDLPPQQAGEFAMEVAQTKFLYDNPRIPSPVDADPATKERWEDLRSGMDDRLEQVESLIGLTRGVPNAVDRNLPRTRGQKLFDVVLYPLIANLAVWGLSVVSTYFSNTYQNKENWFVKRSDGFKEKLAKIPKLGENPSMVNNLNMVVWSFVDGTLVVPFVALFESKRQKISRMIDDKLGTTPEDTSIYEHETKRSWSDVFKARATTFGLVIATFFALNAKIFPNSKQEGTLIEKPTNSGNFERQPVQSINGFVFDIPGKIIGKWLAGIDSIRNLAQKVSGKQLEGMAKATGTTARAATATDARFQIEGVVQAGLFEFIYTSLCTAGLYVIGKIFATKRADKEAKTDAPEAASNRPSNISTTEDYSKDASIYSQGNSKADQITRKQRPQKTSDYVDVVGKSRVNAGQLIGG